MATSTEEPANQITENEMTANVSCTHGHDEYTTGTVCAECTEEADRAKREADRAAYKKQEEARWAKEQAIKSAVLTQMASAVIAIGGDAVVVDGALIVDGVDLQYLIDIDEVRSHQSSWRSIRTGNYRAIIRHGGSRQSYTRLKDKTFSKACAEKLREVAEYKTIRDKAEQVKKANNQAVARLVKANRLKDWSWGYNVEATESEEAPVRVKLTIDRMLSEEEAQKLLTVLINNGFISQEKE
jgi:hypothetical protein